MSLQDAVELGASMLVSLGGGGAIVFGLSSYLGKRWADSALEKEKNEYTKMLQAAKGELDKATNRYQVALDALGLVHKLRITEEFNRLGQLWKYLAILQEAFGQMFQISEFEVKVKLPRIQKLGNEWAKEFEVALKNARDFFLQEKLFIPEGIAGCASAALYTAVAARNLRFKLIEKDIPENQPESIQVLRGMEEVFASRMEELDKLMRQHIEGRGKEVETLGGDTGEAG
jgi:hypothetical protein